MPNPKGKNDLGAQSRGPHPTQRPVAPSSSVKSLETGTIWSKETSSPVMAILRCVYRKRLRAGSRGKNQAHWLSLRPIVEALGCSHSSLVPRAVLVVPSSAQSSYPLYPQYLLETQFMDRSPKVSLSPFGTSFVIKTCAWSICCTF